MKAITIVRPDSKGRITLGKLAKDISSYRVFEDAHHRVILEPYMEVPAWERWLLDNKVAQNQVKSGIKDSARGEVKNLGSFAKYAKDDQE